MRKHSKVPAGALLFALAGIWSTTNALFAADTAPTNYGGLSQVLVDRAAADVTRIRALVDQGTLSKSQLEQAEARLADAQDQAVLSTTLYGQLRLEDMTPDQADAMVAAAQRRVDRQARIVEDRRKLLDSGILARAEFSAYQDELDARQRVLELARNRVKLLADLHEMAENEQRLLHAVQAGAHLPRT